MQLQLVSPMESVFPGSAGLEPYSRGSALRGEETAFQAVVTGRGDCRVTLDTVAPVRAELFRVGCVPCALPAYPDRVDADYSTTQPGEFPDVLYPIADGALHVDGRETLWISLSVAPDAAGGIYPVTLCVEDRRAVFELEVLPVALPPQRLCFTQWFHADCIASLHNVEIYSEAHWALLEKYMRVAAQHGINMLLTPVLTPALDVEVGKERPCTQLLDIAYADDRYTFGFEKLGRWIALARRCGIRKFEISHLFTQWGAEHAPNIYVVENGVRKLRFGWHTAASDPAYAAFLAAMLPALLAFFAEQGVEKEDLMFHISDEPSGEHLESYLAAKSIAAPLLPGCMIRDALSDYEFYARGVVERPIVATDHMEPFVENHVSDLWAYVCCGQCVDVGNRFLAMPRRRNRILGVQLWKYRVTGFLQWGFNFWYTALSKGVVDPFQVTDAGGAFPGGDAFSVYPGADGPLCSVRLKIFAMALNDLRALQALEARAGREAALSCLGEGRTMTFKDYPRTEAYLPEMRERVHAALVKTET